MSNPALVTGYVCECCGEPVSALEVLNKRSECCGFKCVFESDFVEPILFSWQKED